MALHETAKQGRNDELLRRRLVIQQALEVLYRQRDELDVAIAALKTLAAMKIIDLGVRDGSAHFGLETRDDDPLQRQEGANGTSQDSERGDML
jgi:hypothetical protein